MVNFIFGIMALLVASIPIMIGSMILHHLYIQAKPENRFWGVLYSALLFITIGIYTVLKSKGAF